jgi:hypothetical protein
MNFEVKNALGQVYYTCEYKEKEGWFHGEWSGYVSSDDVIRAVKLMLEKFGDLKYSKSLNDSSKGEGSWDDANDWLAKNWMPMAIANGLKHFAFVVSPDIFSAMSSDELATKIPEAGFEMRTFSNKPEAEEWLRSVN